MILNKDWNQINFNGWDLGSSAKNPQYYLASFAVWWKKTFPNTKVKNIRNLAGELTSTSNWTLTGNTKKALNNNTAYELLSVGFVNDKIYTNIKVSNIVAQGSKMPNTLVMHTGAFRTNGSGIKKHEKIAIKNIIGSLCDRDGYPDCTDGDIGQCATGNGGYAENTQGPQYWNPSSPIPHIFMPNDGGSTIYNALYQEETWRELVHCFEADSLPVWMSIGFVGSNKYTGIEHVDMNNMSTWLTSNNIQSDGSTAAKEGFSAKNNYICIILLILACMVLFGVVLSIIIKNRKSPKISDFFLSKL